MQSHYTYDGQTIQVQMNSDMQSLLALHLYDMQGRLIREQQGDIMHMNGLNTGLYFLNILPYNSMHAIMHKP